MRRARMIGLAIGASAVAVGSTPAAMSSTGEKLPGGDPRGVALIAHVAHRYLTVPGVSVAVPGFGVSVFRLRAGIVVSEAWTLKGPAGEYVYLGRPGKPVFEYLPTTHCWQRQRSQARGLSLPGLGKPFVTYDLRRVGAPVRAAGGWTLPITSSERSGVGEGTLTISSSYLLRSVNGPLPNGKKLTERIYTLDAAPRMPVPWPTC